MNCSRFNRLELSCSEPTPGGSIESYSKVCYKKQSDLKSLPWESATDHDLRCQSSTDASGTVS